MCYTAYCHIHTKYAYVTQIRMTYPIVLEYTELSRVFCILQDFATMRLIHVSLQFHFPIITCEKVSVTWTFYVYNAGALTVAVCPTAFKLQAASVTVVFLYGFHNDVFRFILPVFGVFLYGLTTTLLFGDTFSVHVWTSSFAASSSLCASPAILQRMHQMLVRFLYWICKLHKPELSYPCLYGVVGRIMVVSFLNAKWSGEKWRDRRGPMNITFTCAWTLVCISHNCRVTRLSPLRIGLGVLHVSPMKTDIIQKLWHTFDCVTLYCYLNLMFIYSLWEYTLICLYSFPKMIHISYRG
jgi:hypothetical protein